MFQPNRILLQICFAHYNLLFLGEGCYNLNLSDEFDKDILSSFKNQSTESRALMVGFLLRHQESAIHRLGGYYYVHDPLNFYHRPYHDHNGVTCVHPNAYALFVASQTYVSGYNWDFVVHIVFF